MVLLTVLGLVLAACGGAQDPAGSSLDGKALTEERCTQCHDLQRVQMAKKSADGWKSTVERMIGKGAQLNNAEKNAVVAHLTEAYPE